MKFLPGQLQKFRSALLAWFGEYKRDLPWRRERDAYAIWLSEIMLQQTRVAAAIPYFERFMSRFPTVQHLAEAPAEEVLRLWAGLGYYSRARNLQRAAQEIVARHNGEFPRQHAAALSLPGVGTYTAAAVLSIVYDQPHAVLDGNVARVLARVTALRGDLRAPLLWRALQQRADALLAAELPGSWNQAMMELGATVCTPLAPKCAECPIAKWCAARRLGITEELPSKRRKHAPLKIQIAAAVFLDSHGRTLLLKSKGVEHEAMESQALKRDLVKAALARRGLGKRAFQNARQKNSNAAATEISALFSHMWRFPSVSIHRRAPAELVRYFRDVFDLHVRTSQFERLPYARHTVTFRQITLVPFLLRTGDLPRWPGCVRPQLTQLSGLPISNATRKIARSALGFLARNTQTRNGSGHESAETVVSHVIE